MKTDLLRIISILILAFLVIARGGVAGAAWQTVQPSALHLPDAPTQGSTTRVSVASDGSQGNAYSGGASVSADGRYVAFHSYASNLVSGDTNNYCETDGDNQFYDNCADVFVHNLQTGITELVSVASDGSQGNWDSFGPSISADGRNVAFHSGANNLVNGDTNVATDVFLHDRQTGVTERISVASNGSQGNGNSWGDAAISADGRYVAFESYASNLVSGDTNGRDDVFVHEQQTNITTRVSVASDGSQGNLDSWSPSVSANGRFVAFESNANNLVIGDINGRDAFVHDGQTGITQRVSVASDGSQGDSESWIPSISADGRYVALQSQVSAGNGRDRKPDAYPCNQEEHCKDTDGNNRKEQTKGFIKRIWKGTMINKVYTGKVVSNKMEKTVVVAVTRMFQHPVYKKTVKKVSKFKAHDEVNQCKVGDDVKITETRPLSKDKRWLVLEILDKSARSTKK